MSLGARSWELVVGSELGQPWKSQEGKQLARSRSFETDTAWCKAVWCLVFWTLEQKPNDTNPPNRAYVIRDRAD